MPEKKYRITKSTRLFMMAVAGITDILTAVINVVSIFADAAAGAGLIIAGIELLLNVGSGVVFFFWFASKGIAYFNFKKRKGMRLAGLIGESIPYVDIFWPGWVISVYNTCKAAQEEDDENFKQQQGAEGKTVGTRTSRKGGVANTSNYRTSKRGGAMNAVRSGTRTLARKGNAERVPGQKMVGDKAA